MRGLSGHGLSGDAPGIDAVFQKIENAVWAVGQNIEQARALTLPLDAARRANLRTLLLRAINRLGKLGLAIEL
jgi:hypothetical protein